MVRSRRIGARRRMLKIPESAAVVQTSQQFAIFRAEADFRTASVNPRPRSVPLDSSSHSLPSSNDEYNNHDDTDTRISSQVSCHVDTGPSLESCGAIHNASSRTFVVRAILGYPRGRSFESSFRPGRKLSGQECVHGPCWSESLDGGIVVVRGVAFVSRTKRVSLWFRPH